MTNEKLYNVYDKRSHGRLVLKNAELKDVLRTLDITKKVFYIHFNDGRPIDGRYRVEYAGLAVEFTRTDFAIKFGRQALQEWLTLNKRYGKGRG